MPSSAVEDYLKQLYLAEQRAEGGLVPMGVLAEQLGVTPGTVTTMVKSLAASRLVVYEPRAGVRLTARGSSVAIQILRRHRLVEQFLVEVLELDWGEVHAEAEVLEHAISDRVLERIDEFLGRPGFDPHGDPIPSASGAVAVPRLESLAACGPGAVEIRRVQDQEPTFLEFAARQGLVPGSRWRVVDHDAAADLVRVRRGREAPLAIGLAAARKIHVAPVRDGS